MVGGTNVGCCGNITSNLQIRRLHPLTMQLLYTVIEFHGVSMKKCCLQNCQFEKRNTTIMSKESKWHDNTQYLHVH